MHCTLTHPLEDMALKRQSGRPGLVKRMTFTSTEEERSNTLHYILAYASAAPAICQGVPCSHDWGFDGRSCSSLSSVLPANLPPLLCVRSLTAAPSNWAAICSEPQENTVEGSPLNTVHLIDLLGPRTHLVVSLDHPSLSS